MREFAADLAWEPQAEAAHLQCLDELREQARRDSLPEPQPFTEDLGLYDVFDHQERAPTASADCTPSKR